MASFVSLDFEFGMYLENRVSIVEIGMQKVIDNQLMDNLQTLINPQSDIDNYASDNIHHIYKSDILFAPTFADFWPKMLEFIGELPVIVHGIKNEKKAIETNCDFYNLNESNIKYIDTLRVTKDVLPDLDKYNLNYLGQTLNIKMNANHEALDDAIITAKILLKLIEKYNLQISKYIVN